MSAAIGLSNSALFRSGHIQWQFLDPCVSCVFNLWNFTQNIWQIWLQWYLWKFETRIGLDSLHSGPKHFARHRIWTFLTLILTPLAIFSISHIFYHLTNTWWKTSRALQPNSFWCFKTKNPSPGISTSLQCQCLRLRTSKNPCRFKPHPWRLTIGFVDDFVLPSVEVKGPRWIGDAQISTASCPLHASRSDERRPISQAAGMICDDGDGFVNSWPGNKRIQYPKVGWVPV